MLSSRAAVPAVERGHSLDRERLLEGRRRAWQELVTLEMTLVAQCERRSHSARRPRPCSLMTARHWDRPTWQRYLAAAAQYEPEYAPRIGTFT